MNEKLVMSKEFTAKPYAASKYVVYVCTLKAGSSWDVTMRRNGWRYFVQGNIHVVYPDGTETNLVPQTLIKDTLAEPKSTILKEVKSTVLEDAEWVCYSDIENNNVLYPEFTYHKEGDSFGLTVGEDMFLTKGTMTINGKEFIGPVNIRVRKSDVTCNAITECYTFKFE